MDWSPLVISLKTSLMATALAFVLGIVAARLLQGFHGRVKAVLDVLLVMPMVLPPTVVGFFLLLVFGRKSPVGAFLFDLGIRVVFSWEATVIAATVVAFPLVYRTFRGSLEQIDPTIVHAARTLGLPEWLIFLRIQLPMAWPGAIAGTVLGFARALGEFGATLMLAGNIPGRTQTIPVAIFFAADGNDMDKAKLWVAIIVAISFAVVFAVNLTAKGTHEPARRN